MQFDGTQITNTAMPTMTCAFLVSGAKEEWIIFRILRAWSTRSRQTKDYSSRARQQEPTVVLETYERAFSDATKETCW